MTGLDLGQFYPQKLDMSFVAFFFLGDGAAESLMLGPLQVKAELRPVFAG